MNRSAKRLGWVHRVNAFGEQYRELLGIMPRGVPRTLILGSVSVHFDPKKVR